MSDTEALNEESTIPYDIRAEIDWIDFSSTANPLGTPDCIKGAILHAIAEGDLEFEPNHDGSHLSRTLARYHELPEDAFIPGTSATSLISTIAQAYRPCNVGIPSPAPAEFFLNVANVGHNPIKLINPYSVSAVDPEVAFNGGVKFDAAVLANPSYPCARLLSERTLEAYLKVCNWVIVDESRIDLTLSGESYINLTQKYPNLLVIRSISETYGMPSIPISYAVGHVDSVHHIKRFMDCTDIGMFHEVVSQQLPRVGDYIEATNELLDAEIPWMQTMLSLIPGIKIIPSEANFVMCSLKERAGREFGIVTASDLIMRLEKVGITVKDLSNVPSIEGERSFLVAIRTHEENQRLIQELRGIMQGR